MGVRAPRVALVSEMTRFDDESLSKLSLSGFELRPAHHLAHARDEAALVRGLSGAWAVVAGVEKYSAQVLAQLRTLRVIARTGVGFDNVDLVAATQQKILVVTTPDANTESVADFTIGLMLATVRHLVRADQEVRSGRWRSGVLTGDLYDATVGLIGLGRVGTAVARRLVGFHCRILAADPAADPDKCRELKIELLPISQVLSQVDILSIHVPLNRDTKHLIGSDELNRLRPGAVLVNTSRGGVVNELSLLEALRSGHLAGAALDVFENEPLIRDHPLLTMANVVTTGHVAAFSRMAAHRTVTAIADALIEVANDKVPIGCVNPEAF